MNRLPFRRGQTVVIEEQWRGQLWSACPARVVQSARDQLVSWQPTGTISVVATNRGMPQAAGLSRSDRKLLAMQTSVARAAEVAEAPDKLYLHRVDRWARVNLGWDGADHRFLGWYVNFERPVVSTEVGVISKDLVLDLLIEPDRSWSWKDRDDFETAIERGVLEADLRAVLQREADQIVQEVQSRTGPFSDKWMSFVPDQDWAVPRLPEGYRWGGERWALPPGRRAGR